MLAYIRCAARHGTSARLGEIDVDRSAACIAGERVLRPLPSGLGSNGPSCELNITWVLYPNHALMYYAAQHGSDSLLQVRYCRVLPCQLINRVTLKLHATRHTPHAGRQAGPLNSA